MKLTTSLLLKKLSRTYASLKSVPSSVSASYGSQNARRSTSLLCRSFCSAGQGAFSSYEYPLATEAPLVTRTNAKEVSTEKAVPYVAPDPADPFDDAHSLSEEQREQQRLALNDKLRTELKGSTAITPEVPHNIPANVPASQLAMPHTELTRLENGIRVVSQETYGQVSAVGVVSALGSRLETPDTTGVVNLLETLAFGSTKQYSGLEVTNLLQDWGGNRFVSTGREQSLHCIDLLRPNVDKAIDLLRQVLLEAEFTAPEVEDAKRALEYQALDMPPELVLGEALQTAAYGADQQLGQPHFLLNSAALPNLTAEKVHAFWQRQFLENPQGLVIGGAGVQHDYLVELAAQHFGHLQQNDPIQVKPSTYRGGEDRRQQATVDGLVRVAIGLEVGGWHSDDLVATCVLQTLLGGGNSFSAGGPGKGMYSRLYRQVLNRYHWAEAAEAYTTFHGESGLWGISGNTFPHNARDMVQVFAEHLARLAVEPVSDEELDRARNMLKCNVLTQLESRLVLFEDLGRQVLTFGHREDMHTTCEKIDAVSQERVQELAMKALSRPPTVASVGDDLSQVPRQEEVANWFQ